MQMLRTMIFIPSKLKIRVETLAKERKTSQASIFRGAIEEGLGTARFQSNTSAEAMLKIAQLAEKLQAKGHKDLSENLES